MSEQLDAKEIKQVLTYIEKISEYDMRNFNRLQQINGLVWGLLFIISGIHDYIFYSIGRGELTAISWALASIVGLSLSIFINFGNPKDIQTKKVKEISTEMQNIYKMVIILTLSAWITMTVLTFLFTLYQFIMPIVAFLLGTTYLSAELRGGKKISIKWFTRPRDLSFFIPFASYMAFIINTMGYFLSNSFINFMGLIVGLLIGSSFIITALASDNPDKISEGKNQF